MKNNLIALFSILAIVSSVVAFVASTTIQYRNTRITNHQCIKDKMLVEPQIYTFMQKCALTQTMNTCFHNAAQLYCKDRD